MESRWTAVRGEGVWGWVKKVKGLSKKQTNKQAKPVLPKKPLIDRQQYGDLQRAKGSGVVVEGKGG